MSPHHQQPPHQNPTSSRPTRVTPWPRNPQPCNLPRSECPDHARNYRAMLHSLERRGVEGPEELEYIYSRTRGPDPGADWCKHSLEEIGVWRGLLVHFGALRGPGGLGRESGRRVEGGRGVLGAVVGGGQKGAGGRWARWSCCGWGGGGGG
ncbi:hypothetical protein G7Y79_00002g008220 [Physcia stellaris]|nr:hypothetical protein G7Y79_00002g008220 [Physcia stellaris]